MGYAEDILKLREKRLKKQTSAIIKEKPKQNIVHPTELGKTSKQNKNSASSTKRTVSPVVQKIVNDTKKPLPLPGQNTGKAATFTPLPVFNRNNANEFVHLSEKPMVNFDMNNTEKYGFKINDNGNLRKAWESDEINPQKYGFDVSATGKIVPVSESTKKRGSKEIENDIQNLRREMATAKNERTAQSIKRSTIGRLLDDNMQIADDGRAQADVDRRIAELNARKRELDKELLTVKKAEYKALSNNYDFDKLSKPITDKSGLPREYKYINDIDGYRKKERDNTNDSVSAGIFIYDRLSPEEIRTYNYLFATSGKEKADDYLEVMREELNARQGRMYASDYQNSNTAEKILHGATIGVGAGIEDTLTGLKQLFSEKAMPTTANQYAADEIRPQMSKAGGFLFDAGRLVGGQLPNIVAAPFIGGGAASTLLGLSAGGNAYKEKIEEGYSPEEARGYAAVIGLLEGALQYAIGGITSMGRKPSSKSISEMANAIRSAVLRLPVKLTISGGKEASEEMLQDFLVPVVETLMLGEEYEPAKLEDMLYTGLLAFATNGIFNAGDIVSDVSNHRAGKQIIKDGKTDALIDSGLKSGAESETYKLAEQLRNRQEKGKKISPYQLGELKRQTEFATAQKEASLEEVQPPKPKMGSNGQRGFAETYVGDTVETVAPKDATAGYKAVYNSTIENRAMTEAEAQAAAKIPDTMVRAAESAARADMQAEETAVQNSSKSGLVRDKYYRKSNISSHTARVLDAISRVAGTQVRFVEQVNNGKDNARYANGVIEIALNSKNPVRVAFTHELVHRIKDVNLEAYTALQNYVYENMNDVLLSKIEEGKTKTYTEEDSSGIREEVVADAFGYILGDDAKLEQFVQYNRTTAQKLYDVIHDLVIKIKQALGMAEDTQYEEYGKLAYGELAKDLDAMAQTLGKALESTAQAVQSGTESHATVGTKHSIKKTSKMDYTDQLMQIEHGKMNGSNSLYVGIPSANMQKAGISNAPFAMNQSDYRKSRRVSAKNKNYSSHSVPYDFFERLPHHLNDAAMFIENGEKITVVTGYEMNDTKGEPSFVIAGVWKNQSMESDTVNQIKSIYPLDDLVKILKDAAESGNLLITNKNKVEKMLHTIGVQPAEVSHILNLAKESISQPNDSVNSQLSEKTSSQADTDMYKSLIEQYGAIEPGEKPARDVQVPKKTSDKKKVSQTVRTILEAKATPEILVPPIEKMVEDGDFSYNVYTDKAAIKKAESLLTEDGYEDSLEKWYKDVSEGKVSKDNTTLGWALYNNAANTAATTTSETERVRATKDALNILEAIQEHQRDAGQAVQATRILKKLSPETQLYSAQRKVSKIQDEVNERVKGYSDEDAREIVNIAKESRSDAANAVRNSFDNVKVKKTQRGVKVEGNQAGEPFVFEYAQKVGETVARQLITQQNQESKKRTFLQQITSQIKKFAMEKMPPKQKEKGMTSTELLRDYIQNQEFYTEAWENAQEELRRTSGGDPNFDALINSGIGVDGTINPRNAIFMRALVNSAIESGESKSVIRKQAALGFTGMYETIAEKLIAETGAKGDMAQTIRDAAHAYVYDVVTEGEDVDSKIVESAIRAAMKDINTTISDAVLSRKKESVKQAIIEKLVGKYGFGMVEATNTANVVTVQFDELCRNYAQNKLESTFKEKSPKKKKTTAEKLEVLATLGAFDVNSKFNEAAAEKIFKLGVNIKIDEQLAQDFLLAENQTERDEILKKIYLDIGRQVPPTFGDKWNAFRYLAMLFNLKTHKKNVQGNAIFAPVVLTKDLISTTIETVAGDKIAKTKSFVGLGKNDRALLKAAWDDYANIADMIGRKYGDNDLSNKWIQEGRTIFKTKTLEKARKLNTKALEKEDTWFSRPHYALAMAQYCKANGITAEQIKSGKNLEAAEAYAKKEAEKATFRDINAFSQMISDLGKVRKGEKNVFKNVVAFGVSGVQPFRATPANVLARAIEYSPASIITTIPWCLNAVRKGNATPAEAIDTISAGLTGTGLLLLGMLFSELDLVRGHGEEDKDEKQFQELQGKQAYSMNLPNGVSMTLDWAAPAALPFFAGVNVWESNKKDGKITLADWLKSASRITEPFLEMSCMQGLNDLIESVGYASANETDGLVSVAASAVTNQVLQVLPTLAGQIERTLEPKRMTTYSSKNAFLTKDMQKTIGKASAKIPVFDFNQVPYVDAFGREKEKGNLAWRAYENFISSGYFSKTESGTVEKEIERLYNRTGEKSLFPQRDTSTEIKYKDETYYKTPDEFVQYQKTAGGTLFKMLKEVYNDSNYKKLTDAEKVSVSSKVAEVASARAKTEFFKGRGIKYETDAFIGKLDKAKRSGIGEHTVILAWVMQKDVEGIKDKDGKTVNYSSALRKREAIDKARPSLSLEKRKVLYEMFDVGKDVIKMSDKTVKTRLSAMEKKYAKYNK